MTPIQSYLLVTQYASNISTARTSKLSSSELLKQLLWLPIEWRIRFKLATLTFKALRTGYPPYLSNLLQYHEPVRSLRSSSSHYLSVFRHNLKFGSRAFRSSAPRVWNSLPISIRESQSLPTFRRHLDILFSVSLPPFSCPSSLEYLRPRALILLKTWRYISCLLTYLFYLLTLSAVQYDNLRQSAIFLMFT